jgi:uncharacterized protein
MPTIHHTDADIDVEKPDLLDDFLGSDKAPSALPPIVLDGYLTGVLLAPELIKPSTWLTEVWGAGGPRIADIDEANAVIGAVMARYNAICRDLDVELGGDPEQFGFPFEQYDIEAAQWWAEGFVAAIAVAPEAWGQILEAGESHFALVAPFIMLASSDSENNPFFRADPKSRSDMLRDAVDLLPMAIIGLTVFRQAAREGRLSNIGVGVRARKTRARARSKGGPKRTGKAKRA